MVIVEINTSQPLSLEGVYNIYSPENPPNRKPIPLTKTDERIGTDYIPCDPDKIVAVVVSDIKDKTRPVAPMDDISKQIAKHSIGFLEKEVSNNPEVIRRLGVIAMNTAIEVDIYGNINSTNIMGSKMMNGIGGSGDFIRNAYLSIFTTQSIAKDGDISSIVPMVFHHDHTEHDVHVIVTEQGVADLRGLSPNERAKTIIENCVYPDYKEQLLEYVSGSSETCVSKHTPHDMDKSLAWHKMFLEKGTMKKK